MKSIQEIIKESKDFKRKETEKIHNELEILNFFEEIFERYSEKEQIETIIKYIEDMDRQIEKYTENKSFYIKKELFLEILETHNLSKIENEELAKEAKKMKIK